MTAKKKQSPQDQLQELLAGLQERLERAQAVLPEVQRLAAAREARRKKLAGLSLEQLGQEWDCIHDRAEQAWESWDEPTRCEAVQEYQDVRREIYTRCLQGSGKPPLKLPTSGRHEDPMAHADYDNEDPNKLSNLQQADRFTNGRYFRPTVATQQDHIWHMERQIHELQRQEEEELDE